MIISLDSNNYTEVERTFQRYPRAVFGLAMPHCPDTLYSDVLAQGEDLFICAQGSADWVGHPFASLRFTAAELALWLRDAVIPCNYFGDIYVAAPGADPGYINTLLSHLGDSFTGRVHGLFHLHCGHIIPPRHADWVIAA